LNPHDDNGEGDSSEEGFLGDEGRRRSCKRIKLSPPREFEEDLSIVEEAEEEGTVRYEGEEERTREETWIGEDASRRTDGVTVDLEGDEATPIRSSMLSAKRRTPRTSSERRRRRESARKSLGGTPGSRRKSFAVVVEEDEVDQSHLDRQEKVRDRREEAMELMEKIRKRSEERENRRKLEPPVRTFTHPKSCSRS